MNRQSLAAKVLWIATWAGNFLLTMLAFVLAVTHDGPLEPLLFLTVAVCILAGNFLPLTYYLISYFWEKAQLQAESTRAGETLREAMIELKSLAQRYDDLNDAASKAVLIARQVPERVEEKLRVMEETLGSLDTEHLAQLAEQFTSLSEAVRQSAAQVSEAEERLQQHSEADRKEVAGAQEALRASAQSLEQSTAALRENVEALGGRVQVLEELTQADAERAGASAVVDLSPLEEAVRDLREALESQAEQQSDRLDDVLERLGSVEDLLEDQPPRGEGAEVLRPAPRDEGQDAPEADDDEEDPDWSVDVPDPSALEEAAPVNDDFDVEAADPGPDVELDDAPKAQDEEADDLDMPEVPDEDQAGETPPVEKHVESVSRKKAVPARKSARAKKAPEPDLFDDLPVQQEPRTETSDGQTVLVVKAMIGIANKLFLRGDGPHLDWDEGTRLELSAIGEYRWSIPDLKEPLECQLLLNDEKEAQGPNLVLEPGKIVQVAPVF